MFTTCSLCTVCLYVLVYGLKLSRHVPTLVVSNIFIKYTSNFRTIYRRRTIPICLWRSWGTDRSVPPSNRPSLGPRKHASRAYNCTHIMVTSWYNYSPWWNTGARMDIMRQITIILFIKCLQKKSNSCGF